MIYWLTILALIVIIGNFILEIIDKVEERKELKKIYQNHREKNHAKCTKKI